MKLTSSLRESVAYTHDPAAVDDVPAWAGEGFEWTIPPQSFTGRADRLMTVWRGSRRAIPRRHRRAGGGT